MKRILIPTIDYAPRMGGVARYLKTIADAFPDDVDILFWDKNPPRRLQLLLKLWNAARGYDQIWTSHIYPIGFALYILSYFGISYSVFLHGMDFQLAKRNVVRTFFTKHILKNAHHVFTNTKYLADEVNKIAEVEVQVIYPTLPEEFESIHAKSAQNEDCHLLTVGRLVKRKGHEQVIHAILRRKNITYSIVGDGPEKKHLQALIHANRIEDRVRIYDNASDQDLINHYNHADIFVMPTTQEKNDVEGFGIVYLEAGWFRLPVIASDIPGVDEAVQDGKSGMLVKNEDELNDAIETLCNNAPLREEMGKFGHEYIKRNFLAGTQMVKLSKNL